MSVPKRRKTSSKTRKGRSHDALKKTQLAKCSNCGEPVRAHQACANCGHYKSRNVMRTQADKKAGQQAKKDARAKKAMQNS